MGRQYQQLDQGLRDRLAALKRAGHSNRDIGLVLGLHHTTIGREIRRNSYGSDERTPPDRQGSYHSAVANHKAYRRRKYAKYQGQKIRKDHRLQSFIITNAKRHWNPDEMAGYMKQHYDQLGFYVSKTTIYEWFDSVHGERYKCYLYAKRPDRPRRRRPNKDVSSHIPDRIPLGQRPESAMNRTEAGHCEYDAIVSSKASGSTAALAVLQERSTRLVDASRVDSLAPAAYAQSIVRMARQQCHVRTFTTDNGLENRRWQDVTAATGANVRFTDPFSSWQKGGVENSNKLLRWFFPKGTDFSVVTQRQVYNAVCMINKKPRRCLGYKSSLQLAKEKGVLPTGGALRG